MSMLIIIRGPLGVGKSTIAKELAKKLDAEYYSIDSELEKQKLDNIVGGCIPVENFLKINSIIIPKIKKNLDNGKNVVLDGNFYHKGQTEDIAINLKIVPMIFTLTASLEECIKRDRLRKKSLGKDAAKAVHKLTSKLSLGISIDAEKNSVEEIIKFILQKL